MGNKKHSTDVTSKDPRPVKETFAAELIVDAPRFREAGLLKGTTVEVIVYERNNVHVIKSRDGASLLVKPNQVKRYEFDHLPDMSADDWDEALKS